MKLRSFCGFALIFLSVSRYAISISPCPTGTWVGPTGVGGGNGAWDFAGPPAAWSPCPAGTFPNGGGDTAIFNAGSGTITSGTSITLNSLQFNTGTGNYILQFGLGKTLTFAAPTPSLNVNAGSQTLETNTFFSGDLSLNLANGATLSIANGESITGTGSSTLDINGPGTFVNGNGIPGTATNASIININSPNGPTITNNINASFGPGATINVDAGTINNMSGGLFGNNSTIIISSSSMINPTTINNNGTFNIVIATSGSTTMNSGVFNNNANASVGNAAFGGTSNITINGGQFINNGGFAVVGQTDLNPASTVNIFINGGSITNSNGAAFGFGNANNVNMTITGGTITNSAFFLSGGNMFSMSGGTLTNNGTAISSVNSATISGGIIQNNAGHTLGGANYTMSDGTLINDGRVQVGFNTGLSNGVFTLNGGLVEGKGSFVKGILTPSPFTFVNNSGTVMPGDPTGSGGFSPGTLTFSGNGGTGTYQQNSNGTLVIAIDNASSFGKISANFAELNGKLLVEGLPDFNVQPGQELIIVQTDPNGLSGTFATIQGINIDSLTPQVRYTADSAILFFISQAAQVICCPALNCYAGSFYETIITSVNRINIHLEREMEKMRMHFTKNTTRASKEVASISKLSDRLLADNSDMFAVNTETVEKQEIMKRGVQARDEHPLNIYIGPLGSVGDFESRERGRQVGFDYWSAGVLAGFDYVFDQAGVGLLANYERFEGDVDKHWGEFTINEAHAAAYATYAPAILPELAFDAIVGGGYDWVSIRRNTSTSKAEGHPNTGEFDALFEAEYTFASRQFESFSKNLQVIPLANVQYVYLTIDDYIEHGGSADFSFNKQRIDSLRSTLGARVNYNWECPNVSFIPELYFAWQREYLDTDHTVRATPVTGGPASFIEIDGVGRNFALVGADFLFTFYKRWGLELSYDFEWNDLFTDNFFFAGFNVRF